MFGRATLAALLLICLSSSPVGADSAPHTGIASHYCCTRGFGDGPYLALAGALGGRYTGHLNGYVTVCADRCATLVVVDTCQCYWGTPNQRLVDLEPTAWMMVSDAPLSRGLVPITLTIGGSPPTLLPNTSVAVPNP